MVILIPKIPILGIFWRALEWNILVYFTAFLYNLWPFGIIYLRLFGIVCGHLVYFSGFGMFGPQKSGNPALKAKHFFKPNCTYKLNSHLIPIMTYMLIICSVLVLGQHIARKLIVNLKYVQRQYPYVGRGFFFDWLALEIKATDNSHYGFLPSSR
jgi:xanthine/uracil permease